MWFRYLMYRVNIDKPLIFIQSFFNPFLVLNLPPERDVTRLLWRERRRTSANWCNHRCAIRAGLVRLIRTERRGRERRGKHQGGHFSFWVLVLWVSVYAGCGFVGWEFWWGVLVSVLGSRLRAASPPKGYLCWLVPVERLETRSLPLAPLRVRVMMFRSSVRPCGLHCADSCIKSRMAGDCSSRRRISASVSCFTFVLTMQVVRVRRRRRVSRPVMMVRRYELSRRNLGIESGGKNHEFRIGIALEVIE